MFVGQTQVKDSKNFYWYSQPCNCGIKLYGSTVQLYIIIGGTKYWKLRWNITRVQLA